MNIEPKTITTTVTQKSSLIFDTLNDAHSTSDNITDKILIVEIPESTPPHNIVIQGDEYDKLGQWTDYSLNAYIIDKYNLKLI